MGVILPNFNEHNSDYTACAGGSWIISMGHDDPKPPLEPECKWLPKVERVK